MDGLHFLGKTVTDVTSGIKGIAIQVLEHLNGNVQIAIQMKAADGATSLPDANFIDYHILNIVDDGISDRVTKVPNPSDIRLGEAIKDEVTGFAGIATMKATYINGCEGYFAEPKHDPSSPKIVSEGGKWISAIRVKRTGSGVVKAIDKKKDDLPAAKPGGPGDKVSRQQVQR